MSNNPIIKKRRPSAALEPEAPVPDTAVHLDATPAPQSSANRPQTRGATGSRAITVVLASILGVLLPLLGYLVYARGLLATSPVVVSQPPSSASEVLGAQEPVEQPVPIAEAPPPQFSVSVLVSEQGVTSAARSMSLHFSRAESAVQDIRMSRKHIADFETHGLIEAARGARDEITAKQAVLEELKRKAAIEADAILQESRVNHDRVAKILEELKIAASKEARPELEAICVMMIDMIKSLPKTDDGNMKLAIERIDRIFPRE